MANLNRISLIGRVGGEPEVRDFETGNKITTVSIAVTEHFRSRDGKEQDATTWFKVLFFGKAAETVQKFVHKGDSLYVEGPHVQRNYTNKDNQKVVVWEVRAQTFQFLSLRNDNASQNETPQPANIDDDLPF